MSHTVYDAEVELRIVLGETSLPIKDILRLDSGSIVELKKYVHESVEIYVNNVLYARGSVVSVDDNYGVQITEIVKEKKI